MYCFKLAKLNYNKLDKIRWILTSGLLNKDVWLAGGSLRTLIDPKDTVCDYDLFFKRQYGLIDNWVWNENKLVEDTRQKLIDLGFKLTFKCPEGKLYTYEKTEVTPITSITQPLPANKKIKVQLICECFYESPEHLLSTFDLSPCTFATDGEFVWMYKEGIKDVKAKVVHVRHLVYPIPTMKRIIKYAGKGYETNVACQEFVQKLSNLVETKGISASELDRIYID